MNGNCSIKEYFKEKNIFITGGTGFLGKALIEKLLRSCPDLNKIYVLVRQKRGKMLQERIDEIVSSPIFSEVKKYIPENINKIIPIAGNIGEPGLGVSSKDMKFLMEHINVFFHCAASVNFNGFLKDAILTNLRSVREAAQLALEMKEIDVFIHVSTAYCNIDNKEVVEEILYPSHSNWKKAISIAENCDANTLHVLSQKYIGVFPNTYTYTKHLAEHCVNDILLGKVPTIIYRPTVVFGTAVDPYSGWIENFNGPVGILLGCLSGLLRITYSDPNVKVDYVPVDYVVKSMITAVWYKASSGTKYKLDIYHGSTNMLLSKGAQDWYELHENIIWERPLKKCIWFPNSKLTEYWHYYYVNVIVFHIIPAFFLDLVLKAIGYSPMIFKLQKKIYLATMALTPFSFNEWFFVNTNTLSLVEKIPKKEMHDFNFKYLPISKNNFYQYVLSCARHASVDLLKEDEITDKLYIRNLRMYYLDMVCRVIFYGVVIWYIFFKVNIIGILWDTFYRYLENL